MRSASIVIILVSLLGSIPCFGASGATMSFRLAEPETADGATPGWIVADGEIDIDSAETFRNFITSNNVSDPRSVVLLNSPGGSLFGGMALGEVIREFKFGTQVGHSIPDPPHTGNYVTETEAPGVCLSACAFTFLGGTFRTASDRVLGVHQHYTDEALAEPTAKQFTAKDISTQQIIAGILADYIVRMGVDARFLTKASLAPPQSMYLFTTSELDEFGINLNDLLFTPWALEPYKSGLIAASETLNKETTAALFCRSDKLLRLSISRPFRGNDKDAADAVAGGGIFLFRKEIPAANITGKASAGRATFDFKLPSQFLTGLVADKSGMSAIGPWRQIFYFDLPAKDFGIYARLAARNCI